MNRYLFSALMLVMLSISAVRVIKHYDKPAVPTNSSNLTPLSLPPVSINRALFLEKMPVQGAEELPVSNASFFSLRLYSRVGMPLKNQLSMHIESGKDLEVFASIWNHSNKAQRLTILPTLDYLQTAVRIDNGEAVTQYTFELAPNEIANVPVDIPLATYSTGLHDLMFLVVYQAQDHAAVQPAASCLIMRSTVWVGAENQYEYVRNGGTGPQRFSFRVEELAYGSNQVQAIAGQPIPLHMAGEVQAKTWKIIGFVDNKQVNLNIQSELEGISPRFKVHGELPPVGVGEHQALVVFIGNPFVPLVDDEGKTHDTFNQVGQPLTIVAK